MKLLSGEKKVSKIDDLLLVVRTNMRRIRKEKGKTLDDLFEETGISKSYLSRIENGKQKLNFDIIDKYSMVLGIDPFDFFVPQTIIQDSGTPIYAFGTSLKNSDIDVTKLEKWIQENFKKNE